MSAAGDDGISAGDGVVLARDSIHLGRSSESMDDAIEFVGGHLVELGVVGEGYIDGMKRRERIVSTYLGNGVSMPHGTNDTKDEVRGTAIVLAQYPDGVDWGPGTAHLVIGLAAVGEAHVHVLSQLAEVCQDDELCRQLWATDDLGFVYDTLVIDAVDDDDDEEGDAVTRQLTVLNPSGLHARPAALVVEQAQSFDAEVEIATSAKTANAKSILSVLALGAVSGTAVTLTASGADAHAALDALAEIVTDTEEPT